MKVLFVQKYPCVRAQKIARALKTARPDWKIISASHGPIHEQNNPFDDVLHWQDELSCVNAVDQVQPDIVHSHNEPDETGLWCISQPFPVIHDVHDMTSQRFGGVPDVERETYERADAVVFATPTFEDWAREKYDLERTLVFESRVERGQFVTPSVPDTKLSIVYQGGTNSFPYRKYARDLHALAAQGFTVGVYPARRHAQMEEYDGLSVFQTQPHADLLLALSRYHYAYVGFAFHETPEETQRYCHACLPNKFFDAMAAGVPVIVRNCRAVERLVREHGLGLIWNGGDISLRAAHQQAELRANVLEKRGMFVMEKQTPKLLDLYEEVLRERTGT